jgi:hypothetical protein
MPPSTVLSITSLLLSIVSVVVVLVLPGSDKVLADKSIVEAICVAVIVPVAIWVDVIIPDGNPLADIPVIVPFPLIAIVIG